MCQPSIGKQSNVESVMHPTRSCQDVVQEVSPVISRSTVYIVDDDTAVRSAISLLVSSCGWSPRPFSSAEEFLQGYERDKAACLILDLQMPGMKGVDLQDIFTDLDIVLPVIVVTAYKDHPMAERAKLAGARAVIAKPFREEELVNHIRGALSEVS